MVPIPAYKDTTKRRVERFLKRKKTVLQREVQFLGEKRQQIKFTTTKRILADLKKEDKVYIDNKLFGNSKFVMIIWKN